MIEQFILSITIICIEFEAELFTNTKKHYKITYSETHNFQYHEYYK